MTTELRLIVTGLLFVLLFATGYWLSRLERPRNVLLLSVHKLDSLGLAVFLLLSINPLRAGAALGAAAIVAIVVTALSFVVTVASGAVLTMDRRETALVSIGHKVTPYLALLSTAAFVYLILSA